MTSILLAILLQCILFYLILSFPNSTPFYLPLLYFFFFLPPFFILNPFMLGAGFAQQDIHSQKELQKCGAKELRQW